MNLSIPRLLRSTVEDLKIFYQTASFPIGSDYSLYKCSILNSASNNTLDYIASVATKYPTGTASDESF